jgi:hypothetical protein
MYRSMVLSAARRESYRATVSLGGPLHHSIVVDFIGFQWFFAGAILGEFWCYLLKFR